MNARILYHIIDGEVTGGNIICLKILEEALRRGYQAIVSSPSKGRFTDILRQKGINVYNINTRGLFRFDSAIKLACLIKKERINLVHSHALLTGTVWSCIGAGLAGVPVINHFHMQYFFNPNPFVKLYQFLLSRVTSKLFCTRAIAVSENVKRKIIEQGIPAYKVTVIYNGIDSDDVRYTKSPLEIRNEFGLKQDQRIIGEVGRLCEGKGQDVLLKAAGKIRGKTADVVFLIIGEDLERRGEYKNKLEGLAEKLGLKEQFIFTGYRPDVMDLMNAFDMLVLPSLMEGLSMVILEAMAAKKPVITTPIGGNLETVMDGQTGTIVPKQDPDKLAEAILYHLNNPEISKRMGEKGYERVKEFFPLSRMVEQVMDIYKQIFMEK